MAINNNQPARQGDNFYLDEFPPMPLTKLDTPEISALLFHPRPDASPTPDRAEDAMVAVPGAELHVRYHLLDDLSKPAILFFHGNGEVVSDYDDLAPGFQEMGTSFIAADYRGYGRSTGSPSASTMLADGEKVLLAVEKTLKDKGFSGKLLVMGRSLGSAVAIALADNFPERLKGLLIDSGFTFTMPLLESIGVDVAGLGLNEEDGFANLEKIQRITMATYILHGQKDEIIALDNASHLIAESGAQQKEFQMVPGAGHNNILQITGKMYFEVLKRFVDKIGIVRKKKAGVR